MDLALLIIGAFLMGFLAAIPIGPVQIEAVRRSMSGHLKSSLMVVLGAFCVDVFYGAVAFFGIAPFLEDKKVMAVFWLIGGVILILLGHVIVRHSLQDNKPEEKPVRVKRKRWAFLGGVSLSGVNPMMILWWLSAVRLFKDIGLIHDFSSRIAVVFLGAGSIGIASYLIMLSLFIHWAKRRIPESKVRHMNVVFGLVLLLIAIYFIFSSVNILLTLH